MAFQVSEGIYSPAKFFSVITRNIYSIRSRNNDSLSSKIPCDQKTDFDSPNSNKTGVEMNRPEENTVTTFK